MSVRFIIIISVICVFAISVANAREILSQQFIVAKVNGYPITLRDVDKSIKRQVDQLHQSLTDVASDAIEQLVISYLLEKDTSGNYVPTTAEIEKAADLYQGEIAKVVANDDAQSNYLKKRIATLAVYNEKRTLLVTVKEQLEKKGIITIVLPTSERLETALLPKTTVAIINHDQITASEMESFAALKLYQLRGELYFLRKKSLEGIIADTLLRSEANSLGISMSELESSWSRENVSDYKIKQYMESQKAIGKEISYDSAKPYLEFTSWYTNREKNIAKVKIHAQIDYFLEMPKQPFITPKKIYNKYSEMISNSDSANIYFYSNIGCKQCRETYRVMNNLLADHPEIVVEYVPFIPINDVASLYGQILLSCASKQRKHKQMINVLLNKNPRDVGQNWLSESEIESFIVQNRLDKKQFQLCLNDTTIQDYIERESNEATNIGFSEAPAFVVNGVPLQGYHTIEDILAKYQR